KSQATQNRCLSRQLQRSPSRWPPTDRLFPAIGIGDGDVNGQRSLIAAVRLHDPNAPLACFTALVAVAQKDNMLPIGTPRRGDIGGNLVNKGRSRAGQRSHAGAIWVDGENLMVAGLAAHIGNAPAVWLPI